MAHAYFRFLIFSIFNILLKYIPKSNVMKKSHLIFTRSILITLVAAVIFLLIGFSQVQDGESLPITDDTVKDELVVLWTSGDKDVAEKMLLMYVGNAKKYNWWDEVTVVVWGPSARLLSEDKNLQEQVKEIMATGIHFQACRACADSYGVSVTLEEIGVEVIYIGNEFTSYLKSDKKILTI